MARQSTADKRAASGHRLVNLRRGVGAAALTLGALTCPAESDPVIALYGSSYLEHVSRSLDHVGLAHSRLKRGSLVDVHPDSVDALFMAFDVTDDVGAQSWLRAFRAAGGRLFTFFRLPPEMQRLMGIRQLEYVAPGYRGEFAQIRTVGILPHLPPVVHQRSWNIYHAEALGDSVEVAARWHNVEGHSSGYPALLVGPAGAHLTHVLLDGDPGEAGLLYATLLAHFFPETWTHAVTGTLLAAESVGGGHDSLLATVSASGSRRAGDLVQRSVKAGLEARQALEEERYAEALERALQSRQFAITAVAATVPSRRGEFRGVWLADAEGLPGVGWPQTARTVARNGFNAILARFLGAGEASYPSAILPVDGPSAAGRDRLQSAVKASHAQGLEFHVWKVCYKLRTADSVFVDALRGQNRLQADAQGREIAWLCPSHPANRELELAAAVEVAQAYEIDGLHLDYVRFPHDRACFDDGCRVRFSEQTGIGVDDWPGDVIDTHLSAAFGDWRRAQVSALVRDISTHVRRSRPGVKISAAVFPDWPRTRQSLGQDWVGWIEDGYLDFVVPMDYRPDREAFGSLVQRQVSWVDGRAPLYIGIGAWQLRTPEDLLFQIELTRQAGADGFALFQLDRMLAQRLMPLLDEGPTSSATAPPHRGPVVTFAARTSSARTDSIAGRAYYTEGEPITFSVRLAVGDDDISWSAGTVSINKLDGVEAHTLGELRQGRRHRWWPFSSGHAEERLFLREQARLPTGDYRPVIHGQYRGRHGQDEFLRRGSILRVRSSALLDSLRSGVVLPDVPGL